MSLEFRVSANTILSLSAFLLAEVTESSRRNRKGRSGFILKAADGPRYAVNVLARNTWPRWRAGKAVIRTKSFDVAELFESLRGMIPAPARAELRVPTLEEPIGLYRPPDR